MTNSRLKQADSRELTNFGVLLAQCHWLTVHTESAPVLKGLELGRVAGSTAPDGPIDKYDGLIYYKRPRSDNLPDSVVMDIKTFKQLVLIIDQLTIILYERDILR